MRCRTFVLLLNLLFMPTGQTAPYSPEALERIDARVDAVLAHGKVPTIYVDLDDTLFINSGRYEYLLREYDRKQGTNYFSNIRPEEVTFENSMQVISSNVVRVSGKSAHTKLLIKKVMNYLTQNWRNPESYMHDHLHRPVAERLISWKSKGARIVYVTARTKAHEGKSLAQIKRANLPIDEIYHFNHGETSHAQYKVETVAEDLGSHPKSEAVALLDDSSENIQAMERAHPDMISLQVEVLNCAALLISPYLPKLDF